MVRCTATADTAQDVEALNAKFGIPEHVTIKAGREGLPMVHLQHSCGASAEVSGGAKRSCNVAR